MDPRNAKYALGESSGMEGLLLVMGCSAIRWRSGVEGNIGVPVRFCGPHSTNPEFGGVSSTGRWVSDSYAQTGSMHQVVSLVDRHPGFNSTVHRIRLLCGARETCERPIPRHLSVIVRRRIGLRLKLSHPFKFSHGMVQVGTTGFRHLSRAHIGCWVFNPRAAAEKASNWCSRISPVSTIYWRAQNVVTSLVTRLRGMPGFADFARR